MGVAQSLENAISWYRKAALAGDADAMLQMGLAYADGRGVKQSWTDATQWLLKGAEAGNAEAQSYFALCLLQGKGIATDAKKP